MNSTTKDATQIAFRELLARSAASQASASEAELASIPAQLAELSRRFVALDRRLPAAVRRLEELRSLGRTEELASAQLEQIRRLAGVAEVAVVDDKLRVETTPRRLDWRGTSYELGRFSLILDLAGDVRVESLDKLGPKSAWDHPHVQDGLPCLGNLREGVLKLIAEFELALAVQVLLDFLSTYQPESAYTPIEDWPRAG